MTEVQCYTASEYKSILETIRFKKVISQVELCRLIGISYLTYYKIIKEDNVHPFSLLTHKKLKDFIEANQ